MVSDTGIMVATSLWAFATGHWITGIIALLLAGAAADGRL